MKAIVVLAILVAAALAVPAEAYSPEFDNIDVEEVVGNLRLLVYYGKCFLEEGPCTAEGTHIKSVIGEGLQTKCAHCTPKQRKSVRIMIRAFQKDLPEIWSKLTKKHDPTGQYEEFLNEFLNADD
ncbi:ejaculatory bulb-specific protein 3-like [Maniola hyperantus]|uniref:ejaculatory bulb-specific protein 3-like n=1 Tax=Aphantopus hyperantus TaxID=2795564 RepID=UPI0021350F9F